MRRTSKPSGNGIRMTWWSPGRWHAAHARHRGALGRVHRLLEAFPDQKLDNNPYRVFFASGDWTCSIARFRGPMTGPMKGPDGKDIPPTGKSFEVDFCTVAHWKDGRITEENLFYDLVGFMKQLGLS